MNIVLTSEQMKNADNKTSEHFKVPSLVLMERAALSTFDEIINILPHENTKKVLIVCGVGNNGGDGLALSRMLYQANIPVETILVGDRNKCSQSCMAQLDILSAYGIDIYEEPLNPVEGYSVVVDALFGTGLSREIGGKYASMIDIMNSIDAYKVAIDIASGIDSDTGAVLGTAFRADLTVTFAFAKYGHLLYPGKSMTGRLVVAQIGIETHSLENGSDYGVYHTLDDLSYIPERKADTNKGSYGKVLSITGSKNMAGASYFSSYAACVSGAGLVYCMTHEDNRTIIQSLFPDAVLLTYEDYSKAQELLADYIKKATVAVIGCGLGTGNDAKEILYRFLQTADIPVVIDADALNLIALDDKLKDLLSSYKGEAVLTPHIGEASRLLDTGIKDIKASPIEFAQKLSGLFSCTVVLKDAVSVTIEKSGRVHINTSGNNAMSKGGSGDALAGLIAGLIAQGNDPEVAAWLGVYIHGLAGEAASTVTGRYSMTAEDLICGIKTIMKGHDKNEQL